MSPVSFFSSRAARTLALVFIFGAALAIRLYDLTDLPLDFHATRQLVSAIKARGLYFETQPDGISTWHLETAIRQAKLKADVEPVVFERLVAFTYGFTGEKVWIARIYSSLFWLIGGIFLFLLAREFVSFEGALVSTTYYLIFPYAIIGSRSFQPDPLMVMLILAFWWLFARWIALTPNPSPFGRGGPWINAILAGLIGGLAIFIKFSAVFFVIGGALGLALSRFTLRDLLRNTQVWLIALTPNPSPKGREGPWINAILAGLIGGLAIFIKFSAVFFVIGGALGLALSRFTLRDLLRNTQVWLIALLGALPAAIYLVYGIFIRGDLGKAFKGRFVPALMFDPLNYLQWETKASLAAGGIFIMLGLLGLFLAKDRRLRIFLYGLWGAYILYGSFFNYHIATHDYYHLPFIPIVALSLAPLGDWFFAHVAGATVQRWIRAGVYVILVYGLLSVLWDVRNQMKAVDYRPEAAMWLEIGDHFEGSARIIALTQDYGSRLQYWGWQTVATWPYVGDAGYANIRGGVFTFDDLFDRYASKMSYFLVTDFEEFNKQPELKERLSASYPVYWEGNGFVIFDLKKPLQQDANSS